VQLHRGLLSSTGQEIIVAINHTATPHPLSLPWPAHDHLSGAQIENELHLPGYAVAVLTKDGSGEAGRLAHK
jgi:hypothetical protein